MDDVRKAAAERAARSKRNPIGAGFESERQREKNALVRQLDAQDGRNVHKIAAASAAPDEEREQIPDINSELKKLRETVRLCNNIERDAARIAEKSQKVKQIQAEVEKNAKRRREHVR